MAGVEGKPKKKSMFSSSSEVPRFQGRRRLGAGDLDRKRRASCFFFFFGFFLGVWSICWRKERGIKGAEGKSGDSVFIFFFFRAGICSHSFSCVARRRLLPGSKTGGLLLATLWKGVVYFFNFFLVEKLADKAGWSEQICHRGGNPFCGRTACSEGKE